MQENIQKSYYAIIPANVRYDKRLSANAKLLYGEITALCNEKGYCWARNKYFAELYGVSDRSIKGWIKQLVNYGYIVSEIKYSKDSKGIEARYLRLPWSSLGGEENFPGGGEKNFPGGGEKNFPANNTSINNTDINIKERNITKKEKNKTEQNKENFEEAISAIENYTDNEELRNELKNHLEVRKQNKASMKLSTIKSSLNKLDKIADSDGEKILIVQNAVISGWTGFWPLSNNEKKLFDKKKAKEKPLYNLEDYKDFDIFG